MKSSKSTTAQLNRCLKTLKRTETRSCDIPVDEFGSQVSAAMTFETTSSRTDAAGVAHGRYKIQESLSGAPLQLKEGVHTFMSLVKMHPELHPAVIAAILAQPAAERRALLEAASGSVRQPRSPPASEPCKGLPLTPSSDSDDVWEDAVESPVQAVKTPCPAPAPSSVPMASVVVDVPGDLQRLEREAAECHQAWQQSRQLAHWTRYNDCRKRIALLKRRDSRSALEQDSRFSQLQAQREVHEQRLVELARRRERLRLSRRYHEQTRAHHAQLAQAQLQDKLRELEERAQVRRLQHLQRVQQLVSELSAMDQQDLTERQRAGARKQAEAKPPPAINADSSVDEFTHAWDDFSHWEKMVSDDDKENEEHVDEPRAASLSPVGTRPLQSLSTNQPDLIPVLPPAPGQAGPWLSASTTRPLTRSSSCSSAGPRRSPDSGFEDRKKWFEEALNSWQDEDEFFGSTLYPPSYMRGRGAQDPIMEHSPQWYQAAWRAWQGQANTMH